MTAQKNDSSLSRIERLLKYTFPIISFIAAGILLIAIGIGISIIAHYIEGYELPLGIGISSAIIAVILTFLLDRSSKFKKLFKLGRLNYRWIFIIIIALAFSLLFLIIFAMPVNFDDLELELPSTLNFMIYLLSSAILLLSGYLIYFGVKTLSLPKIRKIKFTIFAFFSILVLLVSTFGFYFIYSNFITFPSPTILNGNGHTDGPWLTWYNNRPNESICITWLTAQSNSSTIFYGTNPSNLNQLAIGSGEYLHKVYLNGLQPNTTYFYYIPETFEQTHQNSVFNFTTASSTQESFKFAIVGDMQPTNEIMMNKCGMVADALINGEFDFICQLGDVASDGGDLEDWHRVFNSFARVAANTPIQAVIGNHDWDAPFGSSNWAALFSYPYQNPSLGRFYSFDYHNAHFVMIDNFEHYYMMSDIQLDWIRNDIIQARANGQDWIFCFFHLCMMTTATSGMMWDLQRKLVPIFDQQDVDAVFFAHDHDYEHYNYTYGWNGLIYDESHNWEHNEVHYFCSGGGGANLEVDYGVLESGSMLSTGSVRWWNTNLNQYQDISYQCRPWNASNFITHPTFPENYTHWASQDLGKYYYHLPAQEAYHDAWQNLGLEYGEQCYHYIQVEIDGQNCTLSVRYPNGDLLRGPADAVPQQWNFQK